MLKHRSLSATALTFFFLLAGSVVAHADAAGSWKLAVGPTETCNLTLADGGKADGCARITKWRARGTGLLLLAANGDVIGLLKAKGDGYEGNRMGDNDKMVLSH